jgi:hypothetical protein
MRKSIKVEPKKRGRPATGKDPLMGFRASPVMRASLVGWAENQPDKPTLSEAIRRLVELGLTVRTKASPSQRLSAARADRAKELAGKTIEKIIDPAAPSQERTERKRRLTKGPVEFREARVDQPKAKG